MERLEARLERAPVFKLNSRFLVFSQLTPKALGGLLDDMVLQPPMSPKQFETWVADKCVNKTFALYDVVGKSLSLLRA